MTPRRLHVVLTCTKRKRRPAAPELELRAYAALPPRERLAAWLDAARAPAAGAPRAAPVELYAGDHWSQGLGIPAEAAAHGVEARLWVCSAGYGLVPADAGLRPYSATFSRGHADAVWRAADGVPHAAGVAAWWRGLAAWEGPCPGAPRTVAALAAGDPGAAVWVVASQTYLSAMHSDLAAAAGALHRPEHLVLVSAGARGVAGLRPHLLEFDWRLQGGGGPLAGAAMSLNVRVARLLLRGGWEPSVPALNERLRGLAAGLAPRAPGTGRRVTEPEVEAFVRAELRAAPGARKTPLLRKLRDEMGWAFEEKRFGRVYERLRAAAPGA